MTWRRAWLRALEYRAFGIGLTFVSAFVITGRPAVSLGVASVDAVLKTVAFTGWYRYRA